MNAGLAYVMNKNADAYDRRQANARKRRAFSADAYRLDAPHQGDEGDDRREDRLLSDRGRGAAEIRRVGEEPDWVREVQRVLDALDDIERRVAEALVDDRHPAHAARLAGTNRMRVYRVIAKLRDKLALARKLRSVREGQQAR